MTLCEYIISPILYIRFPKNSKVYWVFRVDIVKLFPFVKIGLFKHINECWEINELIKKIKEEINANQLFC